MPAVLDLLIADALIVDGTGARPFVGSVAVAGDRIAWIGRTGMSVPDTGRTIPAAGLAIAPGFIDVHNHSDCSPFVDPAMASAIRQGTTTVVVGNCGSSPWPLAGWADSVWMASAALEDHPPPDWRSFADYLDAVDAAGPATNVAALVGHGAVRRQVLGDERRTPDASELNRMRSLVAEAIDGGAVGLSTGLVYVPGSYSTTDEIVALAREVAARGGIYTSHIRGEHRALFVAIAEAIAIGDRAGLPAHVSHLKCESSFVWGRAGDALGAIHAAEDVTADQYPYEAWNSSLASLLPVWAPVQDLDRLATEDRSGLAAAVFDASVDGIGWNRIVIVATGEAVWNGRDVADIANDMGIESFEAFLRLLHDDPDTSCIGHAMDPGDVRTILSDPEVFVASDGAAISPDGPAGGLPVHPREYGTFPRALALARDEHLLPLEAVVRKMTSLPADRFGLGDRGRIKEGAFADLVIFDPDRVRDGATYRDPHVYPDGIELVVVNGTVVWRSGTASIAPAGRALRHG
jgi:N-acyl-D-amino-acid deacylase